jgi:hypothetical protein
LSKGPAYVVAPPKLPGNKGLLAGIFENLMFPLNGGASLVITRVSPTICPDLKSAIPSHVPFRVAWFSFVKVVLDNVAQPTPARIKSATLKQIIFLIDDLLSVFDKNLL